MGPISQIQVPPRSPVVRNTELLEIAIVYHKTVSQRDKTLTQRIEFVPQCIQVVAHICPVIVSGLLFRFGSQAFNHFQLGVGMLTPVEHRAERADSAARNTATRSDESSYCCDPPGHAPASPEQSGQETRSPAVTATLVLGLVGFAARRGASYPVDHA